MSFPKSTIEKKVREAFSLHHSGRLAEARVAYRDILRKQPNNAPALHYLGVLEASLGSLEEACSLMARSLDIEPSNIQFLENYATILYQTSRYDLALQICDKGVRLASANAALIYIRALVLYRLKQFDNSLSQFDKVLSLQPQHLAAINERGSLLAEMGRYDEASAAFQKVLAIAPNYAEAHLNRGNLFGKLNRFGEALAAYDRALAINSRLQDAWLGRGNVLRELKRYGEALGAYDKALALKPDFAGGWLGRGNTFTELRRYDEAFAAYGKALELAPDLAEAWLGRGNVLSEFKRHGEALAAYEKSLSIDPQLGDAWLGRGNVLRELKLYDEAFTAYDKALLHEPDLAAAWLGRGTALSELKRYDEAVAAYDKALALKPDIEFVEGERLHASMHLCDWSNLDPALGELSNSIINGKENAQPFVTLGAFDSPALQLQCANLWVAKKAPQVAAPMRKGNIYQHGKIRLGYVSTDFRKHPLAYLVAELFELHDKERFSVTAYSLGRDDNSDIRRRLISSFDRFIDCNTRSDFEVAQEIADSEIDILIDLAGFTQGARTGIFAYRPAPVQVNYLGYAGTMGAPYIDYIIGDKTLFALDDAADYAEKLVHLPDSFQPNDRKREISTKVFARQEAALPSSAFVFCCFNNNYKIMPYTFDSWMNILKSVDGSVLWLRGENHAATANLKREARMRGVDPDRLVFAQPTELLSDYLARQSLADLFLDTLPYNAHTTASDALWSGLPVLTRMGKTYAGRVAASLLKAVDLPELITYSAAEYEAVAIELALNTEKLENLKDKLARNRLTTPLFDTPLYTKHLEAAYEAMYRRYQAGLPPDHIEIKHLSR